MNERTGGAIKLSLKIGPPAAAGGPPTLVPVGEKLTADLSLTTSELAVEATYDSGAWTSYLKGQRDGNIPLTMYLRQGSAIYKAIRDAAVIESAPPVDFEYDTPNETWSGKVNLFGFNITNTSSNAILQVTTSLRLMGAPTLVDKP